MIRFGMIAGAMLAMSGAALAQMPVAKPNVNNTDKPVLKLCTGPDKGNYQLAGLDLKREAKDVTVEVFATRGSVNNLDLISSGTCDAAFVQSDALGVYNQSVVSGLDRADTLYNEYVHGLCNRKANVSKITDLKKGQKIAIGPEGSGSRTTWDGFAKAAPKSYGPNIIDTDSRAGIRALAAVSEGSEVQCMIWVSALKSPQLIEDAKQYASTVTLVATADSTVAEAMDARKKPIYQNLTIDKETYPNLMPTGFFGGAKAIDTIAVSAVMVVSQKWIDANERDYDKLLRSLNAAKSAIRKRVGG